MTNHAENIQRVRDILYGEESVRAAREIFRRVRGELAEIQMDPALSGVGIAQKQREAQARGAVELAKIIRADKAVIDAELAAAEKSARAALSQPNAKPDADTLRDFNEKYGALKTELVVFGNASAAAKMIEFMQSVKDPYLAKTLTDEFSVTGAELQKHIGDPTRLRTVYENVKATAATDSRELAKQALAEIESMRAVKPINSMVSLGANKSLGEANANAVLADHEGYLRAHGE